MGKVIFLFNRRGGEKMNSFEKTYDVMDIAKYVINKSIDIGNPISNLKLQKILYFIQGKFFSNFKKRAFFEDIQAWRHGPVVPQVYYEFNKYIANEITCKFDDIDEKIFDKKDREKIDEVINDKCKYTAWQLVKITHDQLPWKKNYKENENKSIPIDDIKEYFCNTH